MARDLNPKWKKCRREKYSLFDNDDWKRRPNLPGVHTVAKGRLSEYGMRFREKQKVKRVYGVLETQFRKIFENASKQKGNTGVRLLQLLELRLDNVVYRLGLSNSRQGARQLVTHGHIQINNKKNNIPSYTVKVGEEIYLSPRIKTKNQGKIILDQSKKISVPKWLEKLSGGGKVKTEPTRDMMDKGINENFIVEYY